jgi:RNA polymerase sigma-70 factor (ECF subfamily)
LAPTLIVNEPSGRDDCSILDARKSNRRSTVDPVVAAALLHADDLYSEHAAEILRFLCRLVGSRTVAEDLLQETFLKVHEQLERGVSIVNPRGWLYRIALNAARTRQRGVRRARLRESRCAQLAHVVDVQSRLESRLAIAVALKHLKPRARLVLRLFSEGFTYREIGETAHVDVAYVGVLLRRARLSFRASYENPSPRQQS